MEANPIRRQCRGRFAWSNGPAARAVRQWFAVCPTCGETINPLLQWGSLSTGSRKTAKDALYHHQKQHEPGSVGR